MPVLPVAFHAALRFEKRWLSLPSSQPKLFDPCAVCYTCIPRSASSVTRCPPNSAGISGEYYNPEIMRSASSTELHRHMSWVMAESGVPWEENDDTWCCPECFILYSINVFRVRKARG